MDHYSGKYLCLLERVLTNLMEPWAPEEIGTVWGLPGGRINQCESMGWKKLKQGYPHIISRLKSSLTEG
jgi:hypothetical protein